MNGFPLVSIALCTYNGAHFLGQQLDSIINQTYPNLEIIVVDDFSVDNTIDILRAYEVKYSNFSIFVNESNRGVNYSFSRAISLCHGEFIAISDQDDVWFSKKIEDAYNNIGDNMMIYSNSQLMDENGNDLRRRMFKKRELHSGSDPRNLSIYNNIAGHTVMFRSELKAHILPVPYSCHYDWWIAFVATNLGSIDYLDVPYSMHRIHSANVSGHFNAIRQDRYDGMLRWTETMLSVPNLKEVAFFEELHSTLKVKNTVIKKLRLIIFQIKHRDVIFLNKGFFSSINRARKLRFPYIP